MSEVDQKSIATVMDIPLQVAIPVKKVLPWALLGGLTMILAFYFVGAEQGATHLIGGMGIHEFVHDARHLLGFPCH
jgi:Probable cobalt transporter subunit (CbtB)